MLRDDVFGAKISTVSSSASRSFRRALVVGPAVAAGSGGETAARVGMAESPLGQETLVRLSVAIGVGEGREVTCDPPFRVSSSSPADGTADVTRSAAMDWSCGEA